MWPRFSVTSPNIVVRLAPLLLGLPTKGIKRGPLKGNIWISTQLCLFFFFFFQFCPVLPDIGKASLSSGLNVASAVDSQAHKESYIYGINDTLHPPHNSCLLHLVDWDCRHSHSTTTGKWKQFFGCNFSMPDSRNQWCHSHVKTNTCSTLMPVSIMITRICPPPPLFVFLASFF